MRRRDRTPSEGDPGDEADWSYSDSVLHSLVTADKFDPARGPLLERWRPLADRLRRRA